MSGPPLQSLTWNVSVGGALLVRPNRHVAVRLTRLDGADGIRLGRQVWAFHRQAARLARVA